MSQQTQAFIYRMWNTIKYPLISIALGLLASIIKDVISANTITVLFSLAYWDGIIVLALKLLGGLISVGGMAGADKVLRLRK